MKTIIALLLLALLSACTQLPQQSTVTQQEIIDEVVAEAQPYNPIINPADFSSEITNPYFTLTPETTFIYEGKTEDGLERIEVYVTNNKKTIMGVETLVVRDRVWLDGDLIEDTEDYYAQDNEGNVWYFGEDTAELIDGKVINHNGAWETGKDGAKPGIVMLAQPKVDDSYYQEYYQGVAEDKADVLSINEAINVPYGKLNNCLKTKDYTPLEPGVAEHKYYCLSTGFVTLEAGLEDDERVELIDIRTGSEKLPEQQTEQLKTEVSEGEAKTIARTAVSGEVTDVSIERKFGKIVFVVEIQPGNDSETDVIVDSTSGKILGVET